MHKNGPYVFVLLAVTLLIVLPVAYSVNAPNDANRGVHTPLLASGSPMPAPTPPAVSGSALWASGSPMPAPTPPAIYRSAVIASGSPKPAPVPPLELSAQSA